MILFFIIVIPIIYYLFLKWSYSLYKSIYDKIGELEIKIIKLEAKLKK